MNAVVKLRLKAAAAHFVDRGLAVSQRKALQKIIETKEVVLEQPDGRRFVEKTPNFQNVPT